LHAAASLDEVLLGDCSFLEDSGFNGLEEKEKGRAAYFCATARAGQIASAPALFHWASARRLRNDEQTAELSRFDQVERWYWEGRLYAVLPESFGGRLQSSLVALLFLSRAMPDLSSPDFFLARDYELKDNFPRARELWQAAAAHTPADARTSLHGTEPDPADLDGKGFGIAPSLFGNAQAGIGAAIRLYDDAVWDTDRRASLTAALATRNYWALAGSWDDETWLAPFGLSIDLAATQRIENFYGLGMLTGLDDVSELGWLRAEEAASLHRALSRDIVFRLGWRERQAWLGTVDGPAYADTVLPAYSRGLTFGGPFASLAYDTRDSHSDPHRGALVSIEGYFPTQNLGSPLTFQEWTGEVHLYVPLSERHVLKLGIGTVGTSGDLPFSEYPALGGSFALPGVRVGRFTDRNLLASAVEYQGKIWGPFSLLLFGVGGNVADQWQELFSSPFELGFGTGLQIHTTTHRAPVYRLEVGRFGSETLFQAVA